MDEPRAPKGSKWLEPRRKLSPAVICTMCGSELSSEPPPDGKCSNCGADYNKSKAMGELRVNAPDPKGKQYNPYSQMNLGVLPNAVVADVMYNSKTDKFVEAKKKDKKEKEERVFESDEFKQLAGPSDILTQDDDNADVEQTMFDLAIEG